MAAVIGAVHIVLARIERAEAAMAEQGRQLERISARIGDFWQGYAGVQDTGGAKVLDFPERGHS